MGWFTLVESNKSLEKQIQDYYPGYLNATKTLQKHTESLEPGTITLATGY